MSEQSKTGGGKPKPGARPPAASRGVQSFDEPTDPEVTIPRPEPFERQDTNPDSLPRGGQARRDFDESIDTEVDFDAIRAVEELEASMAEPPGLEASPPGPGLGQGYIDILESEVEQLTALIAEKDGALKRADDELARSRERIERDAARQQEQRSRKQLLSFIEVLDDLERALAAARELDHNPAVIDGVELVHRRFLAKLGSFGVSHRPALGQPFDPNLHDAVTTVPTSDPAQNGVVVGVIQEGYSIGEEVLRPAGVAVGKSS